jgi:hypothetical protein
MGRASIFRGKENGVRVQGILTREGGKALEARRSELAKLCRKILGHKPTNVSDADVIEYLARGETGTAAYLQAQKVLALQRAS